MDGRATLFDPVSWLRSPAQAWLDRRLRESTAARDALGEVDGRRFAIELEGPDLRIVLAASGDRLEWLPSGSQTADATLTASPFDAIALARSRSLTALKKTDARLSGNIHVAEKFARVLGLLSPDPEAELAGWIGDMAAHEMLTGARSVGGFLQRSAAALERNATEFFQEEQPMLPRRWEVAEFIEAVDDLRDAVDRAESRLARLPAPRGRDPQRPR